LTKIIRPIGGKVWNDDEATTDNEQGSDFRDTRSTTPKNDKLSEKNISTWKILQSKLPC